MKKLFLLAGVMALALIFTGCAAPTPTITPTPTPSPYITPTISPTPTPSPSPTQAEVKPIVWKAVTFLPKNAFTVKNIYPIAERAKQRSNGQLIIQYLGGPEVVPPPAQAEAVRKNVVQMSLIPVEYYEGMVGLGNMMGLSLLTPEEERASGAHAYINELHNKVGLYYLDRAVGIWQATQFNIFTNKWIDRPQQLAGQKIGASSPIITPFLLKIGAASTIIPTTDEYTALERGVVDGILDTLQNGVMLQLYAVTKYVVDPSFMRGGLSTIINLEAWNKLPPNLQKMMDDIAKETIIEYMNDLEKEFVKSRQIFADKGAKFTQFSDADKEWFLKTVYDSSWEDAAKKYPEVAAKLRPLFTKK